MQCPVQMTLHMQKPMQFAMQLDMYPEPLKNEFQGPKMRRTWCLDDLLEDGSEEENESTDWLKAINRGGLLCVNNMTFELFLTMERELLCYLSCNPDFVGSDIKKNLKQSEDVLFLWSIIGT